MLTVPAPDGHLATLSFRPSNTAAYNDALASLRRAASQQKVVADRAREKTQVAAEASAGLISPEVASVDHLRLLSKDLGEPIYWIGPLSSTRLELSRQESGYTFIRYLPRGVEPNSPQRLLTIGTYPIRDAYAISTKDANEPGSVKVKAPTNAVAFYKTSTPTTVYIAYQHSDSQIEVYSPDSGLAQELVGSGKVRKVG
jgi:hypothetical protein